MKKFLKVVVVLLLIMVLVGFAAALSLRSVFGTSEQINQSLKESGLYDNLGNNLAGSAVETARRDGIELPEEDIKIAAESSFTPQLLQESTENLTEGIYNWLQGRAEQPDFRIDLTKAKNDFAVTLGQLTAERVNDLPECTLSELQQLQGTNIEEAIFSLQCKPPGLNSATVKAQVVQSVKNSEEFLPDTVITADTLPKNEQGQTVFEQYSEAPAKFQQTANMSWVLGIVSILLIGILVLLHTPRRIALLSIGTALIASGVLTALLQLLFRNGRVLPERFTQEAETQLWEPVIQSVVQSLSNAYASDILLYSVIFITLGGILVVVHVLLNRRASTKLANS